MTISSKHIKTEVILVLFITTIFSASAQTSVLYRFVINGGQSSSHHTPLFADIELSDSAVNSGQAGNGDVESITISAGDYVPSTEPVIFSHLHPDFINLTIVLSIDRETIESFSAVRPGNGDLFEYLVLYQEVQDPLIPDVHDNEVVVKEDSLVIRTLLSPGSEYVISDFSGEWRRKDDENRCHLCAIFDQYIVSCFPWCPWPWLLLLSVIIIVVISTWAVKKYTGIKK